MTRFLLMLALSFTVMGADWYAAPGASDSGAGTFANPRSLRAHIRDGFQAPLAAPGDTVWLRGGMYPSSSGALGYLVCNISGTALSPIKFRAYPGEQPAIVGSVNNHPCLDLRGSNTWWQGIEFYNPLAALNRTNLNANSGVFIFARNSKLINCLIHDVGNGVYSWEGGDGSEINGCIIWGYGDTTQLGHGIYNHSATNGILCRDNIIGNGMAWGFHEYAESAGMLSNLTLIGNCVFDSDILNPADYRANYLLSGFNCPAQAARMAWNYGWQSPGRIEPNLQLTVSGSETTVGGTQGDATISSNYFAGGRLSVGRWSNLSMTNNTFAGMTTCEFWPLLGGTYVWDANSYYATGSSPFRTNGSAGMNFAAWKTATSFDGSSTFTTVQPGSTLVVVRTNIYEAGRANIYVFNWAGTDNVNVDPSSVMAVGASYLVRNAANWFGPTVQSRIYAGGAISLPMTNLTVATPLGAMAPAATGPAFNVFVLTSSPGAPVKMAARNLRLKNVRIGP